MKKYLLMLTYVLSAVMMGCSDSDDEPSSSSTEFVLSTQSMTFAKGGGSQDLYIQTDGKIDDISSAESWCKVAQVTTASTKTLKYTVTVEANPNTDDRQAVINVKSGSLSKTVNVTQTAADGLIVSTASFDVKAEGETITVKYTTNGEPEVNIEASWITRVQGRASMQEKTMQFEVQKNYISSERSGKITFTLGDLLQTVTVKQAAAVFEGTLEGYTAKEIAAQMYPGWNLGNTMEATGSTGLGAETSWQGTKTTQAILDYVKSQGFKSVRIPCSWYIHSTDGQIDAEWMNRVKEVVGYCISSGLYVILNDHWDNGWIEVNGFSESSSSYKAVSESTITEKIAMLQKIWKQIAEAFADYDQHLLFAGLNEPFQQYDLFNSRHKELTPILHRYNQAFVDAVRATGGKNAGRILVVQGPGTSISSTVESYFSMPTDNVQNRLMVEVHYYEPWDFCGQESSATWFWGEGNYVSGSSHNATWGTESHAKSQFASMKSKFYDNGVPAIIGEYGANWRSLSANQTEHNNSVKAWFKEVTEKAVSNGCIPMVWDINSPNQNGESGTMTIVNRSSLSIFCAYALDGIMEGVSASQWPN